MSSNNNNNNIFDFVNIYDSDDNGKYGDSNYTNNHYFNMVNY